MQRGMNTRANAFVAISFDILLFYIIVYSLLLWWVKKAMKIKLQTSFLLKAMQFIVSSCCSLGGNHICVTCSGMFSTSRHCHEAHTNGATVSPLCSSGGIFPGGSLYQLCGY